MGCDGGTIPKRKEVVKKRASKPKVDPEIEMIDKWGYCAVSDMPLKKPIVSTHWGDLMRKEGAIEHLLAYKRDGALSAYHRIEDRPGLGCFNKMKDIKELNITELTEEERKSDAEGSWAEFKCPITGLFGNGRYKFVFSWVCGCVVSERAFKEVSNDKKCIVCQKPYRDFEIVVINPDKKDLKENQVRHAIRHMEKMFKEMEDKGELSSAGPSTSSKHNRESEASQSSESESGPRSRPSSKKPRRDLPSTSKD